MYSVETILPQMTCR